MNLTTIQAAIKELIMERFDIFNANLNEASAPDEAVKAPQAVPTMNGHHQKSQTSPQSSIDSPHKRSTGSDTVADAVDGEPPKKKRKPSLNADALFAAKLQAEEDKKVRPTRGGNARKTGPVKKKKSPKKKTSVRVKASDESDLDESESAEKKPPKNTGFHVSSI